MLQLSELHNIVACSNFTVGLKNYFKNFQESTAIHNCLLKKLEVFDLLWPSYEFQSKQGKIAKYVCMHQYTNFNKL